METRSGQAVKITLSLKNNVVILLLKLPPLKSNLLHYRYLHLHIIYWEIPPHSEHILTECLNHINWTALALLLTRYPSPCRPFTHASADSRSWWSQQTDISSKAEMQLDTIILGTILTLANVRVTWHKPVLDFLPRMQAQFSLNLFKNRKIQELCQYLT